MTLTENLAMLPAASVSGIYLQHPQARYFAVGRSAATRWRPTPSAWACRSPRSSAGSRPNLAYEPEAAAAAV